MRSNPTSGTRRTPCLDWTVHRLVEHLVGKNLVFAAVLAEQPLPQRGDGMPSGQLAPAYFDSAAVLLDAFNEPGVLDRTYEGPLGAASGEQRLQIRMYDLLAHGWDLAQALVRPAHLPEDAAEASLAFARAGWPSRTSRRWLLRPASADRRRRPGDRQAGRVPRPRRPRA